MAIVTVLAFATTAPIPGADALTPRSSCGSLDFHGLIHYDGAMAFNGIAFSGYRSIGDPVVKIAPLRKLNFLIGPNNSGKSNILRFLSEHLNRFAKSAQSTASPKAQLAQLDRHAGKYRATTRIGFCVLPDSEEYHEYLAQLVSDKEHDAQFRMLIDRVVKSDALCDDLGRSWFVYEFDTNVDDPSLVVNTERLSATLTSREWQILWSKLTHHSGGDLQHNWIPQVITELAKRAAVLPPIRMIPAVRKIGSPDSSSDDLSGSGIIDRLAQLQNPSIDRQIDKEKFDRLNQFLRTVLENESATLEIPYQRDMIIVHMDGKSLPIDSLGTGIHEVVILGAAATLLENTLLCIEEPELHLHPSLQQKLVRYILDSTSNQYLFATHSAHILETPSASVFHIQMEDDCTVARSVITSRERSFVCHTLGYKASDILQANSVIWVEGPSDRIYLNAWIRSFTDKFAEGIHYSIMFYGGRLSAHLTGNDPEEHSSEVEDFISLRRLNRHAVIVVDSDKRKPRQRLNATKTRLVQEFNSGPGHAWVTKGREIENYVPCLEILEHIQAVHPGASALVGKDEYDCTTQYLSAPSRKIRHADKVKIAQMYASSEHCDLSQLDLRSQIQKLVKFIASANSVDI